MITVNGTPEEFSGTIADLLAARMGDSRPQGIAVAIGDDVVPRDDWSRRPLADGDTVEIVTAVQGG
jgi:sulfur carrier protein